ncbi:hypothetical protein TRFO_31090 [Tritrichomonas foetus]|uniref:Uncharacterized protein n=1 Tax=Tritrichomonas foetus TaxID=1144522 RepID=A0A1J4JT88_9EUKA|nr:hypothetical protein TRFO_31090 [Tritrichomonas foetus]|eukprot:OHT01954.1 hypothetical protein TRFO_31090 [Tritrichomonas foetus]
MAQKYQNMARYIMKKFAFKKMLLAILLMCMIRVPTQGYARLPLPPNSTVNMNQGNSSSVIFSNSPLSVQIVSDIFNRTEYVKALDYAQISASNIKIQFHSKDSSIFHIWKIPQSLCNSRSAIILTDYITSFESNSTPLVNDFCLFSQFEVVAFYTKLSFHSDSINCSLKYYTASKFNVENPNFICHSDENCIFDSFSPFFIKFDKCGNSNISISMTSQIARNNVQPLNCAVNQLSTIAERGNFLVNNPLGQIKDLNCFDASTQFYKVLGFVAITTFFVIIALSIFCCCFISDNQAGVPVDL